jgi:hypothetical protein
MAIHPLSTESPPEQCDIAAGILGKPDCCSADGIATCREGLELDDVTEGWKKLHFDPQFTASALAADEICQTIHGGSPIQAALVDRDPTGEGAWGHLVLITGYRMTEHSMVLRILDPWRGECREKLETLETPGPLGRWEYSWANLGKIHA